MILRMFSIHDIKASIYMSPFSMAEIGMAKREFMNALQDENTNISKHPADFTLFHIGEFDTATGEIKYLGSPHSLGNGLEYKEMITNAETMAIDRANRGEQSEVHKALENRTNCGD